MQFTHTERERENEKKNKARSAPYEMAPYRLSRPRLVSLMRQQERQQERQRERKKERQRERKKERKKELASPDRLCREQNLGCSIHDPCFNHRMRAFRT
jgi:hypothetical protein